ncbi:NfeD family protein [Isoptericola sp. b441]|uniref:NfeD family protein n=1 Tax=Actinotalea lenta TaxID=3064654 RepID=A0ABT9D9D3_9CELL|nr:MULTISPECIES: NfeD family protein [unclassified Isoptericola]MDO8107519.1 NfeD family protein [Isoptericola sp. b441]MDO8120821.1 NfeD family protein [Isoptericola sp. b490]
MGPQVEIHWAWWLVAAIVLAVIEVFTLDLVLLMFAVGAVAALIVSLFHVGIIVQVLTFAGTSIVMLLVLRPYLLRNLRRRTPLVETNTAAHVGRQAITVTEVTDRDGRVKLAGEVWSARARPGVVLPEDQEVVVLGIDGATAIVGPLDDSPTTGPTHSPDVDPTRPEEPR